MSRWLTPASSARRKPRSASSGVDRANAAAPRTATEEWCPVRPSRRVNMAPTVRLGLRHRLGRVPVLEVSPPRVVREDLDERLGQAQALLHLLDLEHLVPEHERHDDPGLAGAGG